jgi:citrate synthase
MTQFYSAKEAAQKLGVSVTTLYAYVSRGKLQAQPGSSYRERRYRAEEVDHLAGQLAAARSPSAATRRSLDFGRPVVSSGLCLIEGGQLYYRGRLATELAQSDSLEAVAAWLWNCEEREAFPGAPQRRVSRRPVVGAAAMPTALELMAYMSRVGDTAAPRASLPAEGGALVRALASALVGRPPNAAPLHEQLADAWRLSRRHADLIRMALVLCADHELNASTFTVRCVASTQASLQAALVAGLAALSGSLHGGATERVEVLFDALSRARQPDEVARAQLLPNDRLPGFGHLLYPSGDVRATLLLERLRPGAGRVWRRVAACGERLTGEKPSVDFALVALRRDLRLPRGAAFALFALGRSVGWIAHAVEQRRAGQLIRPRAEYTGPRPREAT